MPCLTRLRLALLLALGMTMMSMARAGGARRSSPSPRRRRSPIRRSSPRGPSPRASSAPLVFLGKAGRYADPGVAFGVRLGYDLFRWLDVQAHVMGESSNASTPPPQLGQSFQTYLYAGEVRLKLQLHRFQLFAEGGAGLGQLSSNVLDQVGVTHGSRFSVAIVGGAGLDYHTLNRHFSVGLGADYVWLAAFTGGHALSLDAYLRYTR